MCAALTASAFASALSNHFLLGIRSLALAVILESIDPPSFQRHRLGARQDCLVGANIIRRGQGQPVLPLLISLTLL